MGVVWRTALDGCGLEDYFRWVWSGCGTPDRRCTSASWRGVALGCGLGGGGHQSDASRRYVV